MLLPAVSVLVVAQSSSEIPEGLMNNPVYIWINILFQEFHAEVFAVSVFHSPQQQSCQLASGRTISPRPTDSLHLLHELPQLQMSF